jgi:hypothetical protein
MSYYTAKVRIEAESDNGKVKKNTETYLINAESVTHAEEKIYEEFNGTSLDFDVRSVSISPICKVIEDDTNS